MKNNVLVILLCLASIALGFVINTYTHYGDVLLKTEDAYQEFTEIYREGLATCRTMQYGSNDFDIFLYQRVLDHYINPNQAPTEHVIGLVWARYLALVEDSKYKNSVFNNSDDHQFGLKELSTKRLDNAAEFIGKHAELFNRLGSETK